MIFGKEKLHVILQEKDFTDKYRDPLKGSNVDIVYIPKKLFPLWDTSDVKIAILPALNKGGKIIKI